MSISRRKALLFAAGAVALPAGAFAALYQPFPSDHVPEGAYRRIARAVANEDPRAFFAYLEQEAQWACFTLRDVRGKAAARVKETYVEPQRAELLALYEPIGNCGDGSDVFALLYKTRNWGRRLRKDLSGVSRIDIENERATIVTTQGTRYPFRKRDNGIWGLTIFTAELLAEAQKATRDLEQLK